MPLSVGEYIVGLAFFVPMLAFVVAGAVLARRRWIPGLRGVPAVVGVAILVTAGVLFAHLLPGALGVLSPVTVLLSSMLLFGILLLSGRAGPTHLPASAYADKSTDRALDLADWLAFGSLLLMAAFVIGALINRSAAPPQNLDALGFHLPGVATWIQRSSLWGIHQFIPGIPTGEYPQNGDVLMLASILPWNNEAFVRLVNVPFLALLALSVYAASREIGAPSSGSALAAALLLAVPAINEPVTLNLLTDAPVLALLASGVLFLLRHERTGARSDVMLAGLALGLALGTKWYGVAAVVTVVGVWVLGWAARRRGLGPLIRTVAPLVVPLALAGGFWFLRNLVGTGNPFYPVRAELFGASLLSAPPLEIDRFGFTLFHYLGSPDVLSGYVWPAFEETLGPAALNLIVGGLLAGVVALTGGALSRENRRRLLLLASATVMLLFVYVITPGTAYGPEGEPADVAANTRYGTPALVLAAPLLAWGFGLLNRGRLIATAVGLLAVASGIGLSREGLPLSALVAGAVTACIMVIAAVAVARRAGDLRSRPKGAGVVVVAAVALIAVVGFVGQGRYNDGRYSDSDPTFAPFLLEAGSSVKVGIAGYWSVDGPAPTYPPFGPRLENEVEYVGRTIDGNLRAYKARRGFERRLAESDYDYVLVGLGLAPGSDETTFDWARDAGFVEVTRSERLALLARSPAGTGEGDP